MSYKLSISVFNLTTPKFEIETDVLPRSGDYLELQAKEGTVFFQVMIVSHVISYEKRPALRKYGLTVTEEEEIVVKEVKVICSSIPDAFAPYKKKEPAQEAEDSINGDRLGLLYRVRKFASKEELNPIERMITKRGGKLDVLHCKCGEPATIAAADLRECENCYRKGYGK